MLLNKNKKKWVLTNLIGTDLIEYKNNILDFYEYELKYSEIDDISISNFNGFVISGKNCKKNDENKEYILDGVVFNLKKLFDLKNIDGEFTAVLSGENGDVAFVTDFYASMPIYYHTKNNIFIASNDLRMIIIHQFYTLDLSYDAMLMHLNYHIAVGENELLNNKTFFNNIYKVPKGSIMTVDKNINLLFKKHLDYDFFKKNMPQKVSINDFKTIFGRSIDERMSLGKSTIHFSGGLDSGAILAHALQKDHDFICVNMSFKNNDLMYSQDLEIVKNVSKRISNPSFIMWGDETLRLQNDCIDNDPLIYLDGPEPRANSLICLNMDLFNYKNNVTQSITGESGDVILGEQFQEVLMDGLIKDGKLREALFLLNILRKGRKKTIYNIHYLYKYFFSKFTYKLSKKSYLSTQWVGDENIVPDFILKKKNFDFTSQYSNKYEKILDGHRFMLDYLWPKARYFDSLSTSAFYFHPFIDYKLINYIMSIPPYEYMDINKLKYGSYFASKKLVRESYSEVIPEIFIKKTEKTSYEGMAKKIMLNSKNNIIELFYNNAHVYDLDLVDKAKFLEKLAIYFFKIEDVNSTLGVEYQFIKNVITLEIWLRNVNTTKEKLIKRIKPICEIKLNIDVDQVN